MTLGQSPKVLPKIEFSPRSIYMYVYKYICCIGEITIMMPCPAQSPSCKMGVAMVNKMAARNGTKS